MEYFLIKGYWALCEDGEKGEAFDGSCIESEVFSTGGCSLHESRHLQPYKLGLLPEILKP